LIRVDAKGSITEIQGKLEGDYPVGQSIVGACVKRRSDHQIQTTYTRVPRCPTESWILSDPTLQIENDSQTDLSTIDFYRSVKSG
jgi:hypothetical protein